ncbi:ATP-binding protein [Myxococcota bacterium]|nr:ATP-binding protein [Myxococcota bacterium]
MSAAAGLPSLSLRWRLTLSVAVAVVISSVAVGLTTTQAVLRPLERELGDQLAHQAVYVVERLEAGDDPNELAARLDLEITRLPEPPRARARRLNLRGHEVALGGRRRGGVVAVQQDDGAWVGVRPSLDLDRPRRRFWLGLGLLTVAATALGALLARSVSRPLNVALTAMDRMAEGDLGHRLPEQGPKELQDAARGFNRLAERVDGMLRREKELMAAISHELRTPLTRMRLELELLRDSGASESRIAAMEGDLIELDELVGELAELSRLELGAARLTLEPLGARALIEEAARRVPLPEHSLEVVGDGFVLQGDRRLLLRALENLLRNVGRYTPPGTVAKIVARDRELIVEDEGPGVAPEALARLAEPFFRVESSRSKATGGLGLGLFIARRVAEVHGGQLIAEARPGGGLRVRLRLPEQG